MRSRVFACLVAALFAVGARGAGEDAACIEPAKIMFTSDGVLVGEPPRVIGTTDRLTAAVPFDAKTKRARVGAATDALLTAINGLRNTEKLDEDLRFQIPAADLVPLRVAYCGAAAELVATLNREDQTPYKERLRAAGCSDGDVRDAALVPDFRPAMQPYTLTLICRDKVDVVQPMNAVEESNQVIFTAQLPGCREVTYELRVAQPFTAAATAWAAAHPMPPNLRTEILAQRPRVEPIAKTAAVLVEVLTPLNTCIAPHLRPTVSNAEAGVIACTGQSTPTAARDFLNERSTAMATTASELFARFSNIASTADFATWIKQWMWFTNGRPTLHPFLADNLGAKRDELKAKRDQLVDAEAELAAFEKLAASLKIETAAIYEEASKRLAAARGKRDRLNTDIATLTKSIADAEPLRQRDTLLYSGLLIAACPDVHMQHHDAKTDYKVMGGLVREVGEHQNVFTLVENLDPAAEVRLVQTVTTITSDRAPFLEELLLSTDQAAAHDTTTLMGAAANFADSYRGLKLALQFASEQLTPAPALLAYPKDETPTLMTKLTPHDIPAPAPATVTYTVKQKQGAEEKDVATASYRLNRLYRVRFHTGLMYSMLERNKVGETAEKDEITRHGIDATFGVQTYIGPRRDIRRIRPRDIALSVYSGLTVRDLAKSAVVGLGWEPTGGMTLVAGVHVGRSERRRDVPGEPSVEDVWLGRRFYAITFDADFLKSLFTTKPAVN